MADEDSKISQFVELTGSDASVAKAMLEAAKGDVDAALALHFEASAGDDDADVPMGKVAPAAAPPALPKESNADLVSGILSNARQEGDGEPSSSASWSGQGRTLGSDSTPEADQAPSSSAPVAPSAPGPEGLDRSNAKKVRVIFWADGFTVEDVTAEEEAATAAAKAPAAPRRTGVATISSEKSRAGPTGPMPKLPELRSYEENAEFMSDLQQSIPPREFRELDLSTGTPRPRPVDIMLGDMRPQAYPADIAKRMNAMAQSSQAPEPTKSSFTAFGGSGQTLGGGSSSSPAGTAESGSAAAAGSSAADGSAWLSRPAPLLDEAAPTTDVQVRLASGGPQRFRLNRTHTVGDLKALVEAALSAASVAPRAYVLASGFPPKPLSDEEATLEAAGLVGAAVTQRWA